jgi:hypothetical protein
VRLAFAAAIHVDPDVLVVDEALAVGDAIFANRCVRKFGELKARGVTVVLVSHDLALVKMICDRAMLLWEGRTEAEGGPGDVVNRYNGMVLDRQRAFLAAAATTVGTTPGGRPADADEGRPPGVAPALQYTFRHGDRAAEVLQVELYGAGGQPTRVVASGENVRVRVLARFAERHPNPVVGVMIRTRIGMEVYGTNTMLEQIHCGGGEALEPGDLLEVNFEFPCSLTPQEYTLTVATQQPDGSSHDWLDDVLSFQVLDTRPTAGVANLRARVTAKRIKNEE